MMRSAALPVATAAGNYSPKPAPPLMQAQRGGLLNIGVSFVAHRPRRRSVTGVFYAHITRRQMSIISRLRAAWSAIMDVTEQPDVAAVAPNSTLENALVVMRQALDSFGVIKAAHDVARAAVDDAAKAVTDAKADVDAHMAAAEQAEQALAPDLARVDDWLKPATPSAV